ncbi:RluA family pseudouridine synthase [Candidatus Contubernalis alkalaceticus]|nr:RluA family pseudouridine synthase [Candidatus Contubernalis alkalaceticus]
MKKYSFLVSPEESGKRLDILLMEKNPDMSRSRLQVLIEEGLVSVKGKKIKSNYRVKKGDKVFLEVPPPRVVTIEPENIPLSILYQDKDIVVVNKAQGMVVHPAAGHYQGTLVNALLFHCRDLSGIGGELRPGIVHRLDKDTSGVLVAAKNDYAHRSLAYQMKKRSIKREYQALVHGRIVESRATIDAPIGRHHKERKNMAVSSKGRVREAVTHFEVLERFKKYTHLRLKLETGRTHQIRVHMAYIKHPVLGDLQYGPSRNEFNLKGQALHAGTLGFVHPQSENYMEFSAPLPERIQSILRLLTQEKTQ